MTAALHPLAGPGFVPSTGHGGARPLGGSSVAGGLLPRLRLLSLFSGIGGFDLGLEATGAFETVAACDINPYSRAVFARHWPHVRQFADVRTLDADTLARDGIEIDAICAGFPCQDLSVAGKRAGIEGARSGLWSEVARLVREVRPRVVLLENVPGILSAGLGRVLGDLAAIGYDAVWDCIRASDLGAHHRRDRWMCIAYPGGVEHQGPGDAFGRATASGLFGAAVADADDGLLHQPIGQVFAGRHIAGACGQDVADAAINRRTIGRAGDENGNTAATGRRAQLIGRGAASGAHVADPRCERRQECDVAAACGDLGQHSRGFDPSGALWLSEPDVGRVADGVPRRVDRLAALGNAIVPQWAFIAGRWALAILKAQDELTGGTIGPAVAQPFQSFHDRHGHVAKPAPAVSVSHRPSPSLAPRDALRG